MAAAVGISIQPEKRNEGSMKAQVDTVALVKAREDARLLVFVKW